MTNLIYIHTTDLAANDTSATFVINNALSLAHAGAAVTLIVMNRSNENGQMLIRRKFGLTSWPDNLTVIAVRGKSHLWFYLRAGWYVRKTSTSSVILTRSHKALLYLMLWKNRRHKYFFETHDFFYDLSLRTDINPDKRRTKSGIEQKYFRRLDGLVCLNQEQKKLYNNYLQVPIGVFRTGAPRVERHGGVRKKRIVYVGSLNERLGIDRIVKLIPLLGKDVEWLIIGGKTHEEVTGFPRRFPEGVLPANVKITGWIDKNELAGYLHSAQVGLLPLHNTFFNQYLTVPLKLFDYFAFGIPV
ncbi:MAG: glycosyltransferase, partial [Cyclobacteriaceae bacterium]|nr:glycosyltransferase [Cyclobacteriaceae bacterium]